MAIEVEDGTGKANAVAYVDATYADTYFGARGFTIWVGLALSEKEQALVRAGDYMNMMFRWSGSRATTTQRMDWPRKDVVLHDVDVASNAIPTLLKDACCEIAIRAAAGPLLLDPAADSSGRLLGKVVERVGPVESEKTYIARGQMSVPQPYKRFPQVDALLRPLLQNVTPTVYR